MFGQWKTNGVSAWKIPLLRRILEGATFSGKASTRWSPESVHDFMHAKVVVADDMSFVGSFNFSRSGERNAENVLEIRDGSVADRLAGLHRRDSGSVPASRRYLSETLAPASSRGPRMSRRSLGADNHAGPTNERSS